MSVAFLPIDSTKGSLDTATAITASTTIETNKEEDSFDFDSITTTTYTSSTETKAVHYVDTEHYTVTSDLEVWNYRR